MSKPTDNNGVGFSEQHGEQRRYDTESAEFGCLGAEPAPPVTTGGVSFPLDAVVVVVVVVDLDVEAGLLPWSVEGRG